MGIISSSLNDIELDIIGLGRFSHCLGPSLSPITLNRSKVTTADLEAFATKAAAAVGSLRKLSKRRGLNIDFKCYELKARDFSPSKLPSGDWFEIGKVLDKYLRNPANVHEVDDKEEATELCKTIYDEADDKVMLCRGHDVSCVLAILHNHFRKSGRSSRNGDDINDLILGHISTFEFANLQAHQDLLAWLRLT